MASRRAAPPTPAVSDPPVGMVQRAVRPLEDFVAPGRRRTDNPLTVGVIVICLGLITIIGIVQTVVMAWAGAQFRVVLDGFAERDRTAADVRRKLFQNTEAQSLVLRRLCLNSARTESDQKECLTVGPTLDVPIGKGH